MRNELVLSAIASLALVGCSGPDPLNVEDSRVAFAVVSATLVSGAEAASASGTAAHTGDSLVFRKSVEGAVDYDFACIDGGTVHFSGSVHASSDPSGGQATFELSTDFVGCKVMGGNITIDGGMDYSASTSGSSSGDADVTFAMNGSLSFSGDIDGSCDFDVKFSAATTGEGSAGVMYSGSICGHDAAVTLNV